MGNNEAASNPRSRFSIGRFALGLASCLALLGLTSCTGILSSEGQTSGGPSPGSSSGSPGSSTGGAGAGAPGVGGTPLVTDGPGRVVLHRLNVTEYNNTVRDLLGTQISLPADFPADESAYGFDNIASALTMDDVSVSYYLATAKELAAEALSAGRRGSLVACDLAAGKEACVTQVVSALLPRAWRRPARPNEVERLVAVYTKNKASGATDDEALQRVLQALLIAPDFLFRVERNSGIAQVRNLDGYEVAARLSYFLWSSMPDAELTAAAAGGSLASAAGVAAQLPRLLGSDKASAFAQSFGSQWLRLRSLANVTPDAGTYPAFDDELRAAMRQETMLFFTDVASGKRSLSELLTSTSGYVNDRLAKHYGLAGVDSAQPVFTALPPGRAGLLTQGSLLTVLSYPRESAPVRRGNWILGNLLCKEPPPPPPNVPQEPPPQSGKSRKERLAAHRTDAICKACHDLMDPLGLALEQFDGVGAFRTMDAGLPIDPSGTLADGRSFSTAAELAQLIASDPAVPRCVTQRVFAYGLGRAPRDGSSFDAAAIDSIASAFAQAGQMFPKLIEAVVTSDAFLKREDEASAP
jgi:hypothetical protein